MEILRGVTFHQKKSAVSLGKFDGIHLGHQLLMNEVYKARRSGPNSIYV